MEKYDQMRNASDGAKTAVSMAVFGIIADAILLIVGGFTFRATAGVLFALAQIPLFLSLLFAVAALLHAVLSGNVVREEEEKRLLADRPESRLLQTSEDVRFTAKRSLERYVRFAPYVVAVIGIAITAYGLDFVRTFPEIAMRGNAIHSALISALMMLFCVFSGAFFNGQSRAPMCRWLRPCGAELIAAFSVLALSVFAAICRHNGISAPDAWLGKIVFFIFILLAAEMVFNGIVEFYRPRTQEEERPFYESRLLALFTEPGGVMRNIASTLDYQFGFKISGTRLYALIERSFFPLLLLWAVIFWGSTAIHEIKAGECGFRTAFGKIMDKSDLEPGIYLCLPYPFGSLEKFSTAQLQKAIVGETPDKDDPGALKEIVLWTEQHGGTDDQFIVAVPQEKNARETAAGNSIAFIRMTIPILYRVNHLRHYLVDHSDADKELSLLGNEIITEFLASSSMDSIMSTGRKAAENDLMRQLQKRADEAKLGVEIVSLSILDAHPPTGGEQDVAASYQQVIGALEQKETSILEAQAYAARTLPAAEAEAGERISGAKAYEHQVKKIAAAESDRFTTQLKTYLVMPQMFKLKAYLELLEDESTDMRKFIISSKLHDEIYELNFEKNDRLDLLDAQIGNLGK
ncbi:MAG: hypothetical protein MJ033_08220 [Victivallaceae bacterium]|nr:hypothetical protein [Victivallaceae bacterium]